MCSSSITPETRLTLQVPPSPRVHATDGLVLWTVEDTEQLDWLTAITLA
jgi:hypothetical protein